MGGDPDAMRLTLLASVSRQGSVASSDVSSAETSEPDSGLWTSAEGHATSAQQPLTDHIITAEPSHDSMQRASACHLPAPDAAPDIASHNADLAEQHGARAPPTDLLTGDAWTPKRADSARSTPPPQPIPQTQPGPTGAPSTPKAELPASQTPSQTLSPAAEAGPSIDAPALQSPHISGGPSPLLRPPTQLARSEARGGFRRSSCAA